MQHEPSAEPYPDTPLTPDLAPSDAPAEAPPLVVRRLAVDLSQGFARHWNGGDAFVTAFCNALSMSFPVGEQFFIDAVRAGARELPENPENAALHAQVRGFIGQEATHRHLHGLYNTHLAQQGLVNHWGPRATARIAYSREHLFGTSDKKYLHELAITAAYEHYTAIFGDMVLGYAERPGDWFLHADEPLKTLWRWHAAEELEHKSVAFDLYQRLGGNTAWRLRWFRFVTLVFAADVSRQTLHNLWRDGTWWRPSTWVSATRFVFGRHGALWRIWAPVWAYRRADFHPHQQGDAKLATQWLTAHADRWTAVASVA